MRIVVVLVDKVHVVGGDDPDAEFAPELEHGVVDVRLPRVEPVEILDGFGREPAFGTVVIAAFIVPFLLERKTQTSTIATAITS